MDVGRDKASVSLLPQNRLDSIQTLLLDLSQRLEDGPDWDTKRRVVEELVEVVRVDPSSRRGGRSEALATVTYHFNTSIETRTGTRADNNRTCIERVHVVAGA